MEIGKKIRELRIARNLTQEALAAELSPPGAARTTRASCRYNGERPRFVIARPQRGRGNLGKAVTFSPGPLCYPAVYCEIATSLRSSQ